MSTFHASLSRANITFFLPECWSVSHRWHACRLTSHLSLFPAATLEFPHKYVSPESDRFVVGMDALEEVGLPDSSGADVAGAEPDVRVSAQDGHLTLPRDRVRLDERQSDFCAKQNFFRSVKMFAD